MAGPAQSVFSLEQIERVGRDIVRIGLLPPPEATLPRPGQFFSVRCGASTVPLLRVHLGVQEVDRRVVGIGGITCLEDALEFLVVGATAVQVGTWSFVNPRITLDLVEGLEAFLVEEGHGSVRAVIGSLR